MIGRAARRTTRLRAVGAVIAAVGLVAGGSAPPATAAAIDDSFTVYTTDRCGAVDFVDYGLAGVEHKNLLMMVSVGVPAEARRRFQDAANGPSLLVNTGAPGGIRTRDPRIRRIPLNLLRGFYQQLCLHRSALRLLRMLG